MRSFRAAGNALSFGGIACAWGASGQLGTAANMKMPTLEQLRTNRNVQFWSLHTAGWAVYGLSQYTGALVYEKPSSYGSVIAVSAIAGFVLSIPLRYIYHWLWSRPPRDRILGVLASSYVTAAALRV